MKKTIANALHSGSFSVKPGSGRSASTEIPFDSKEEGIIRLPEVDGKLITQENHDALKAHEYGHIALVERNILPLSFIEKMREKGADDYLIQSCMDAAVNSFIGQRCKNLPFEHDLMPKKKFLEKFEQLDVGVQASYVLQVYGVYYGAGIGLDRHSRDKEARLTSKRMEGLQKNLVEILCKKPYGSELRRAAYNVAQYCSDTIRRSSSLFDEKTFFHYAACLILSVKEAQEAQKNQDEFLEKLKEYDFPVIEDCAWGEMDIQEMPLENSMMRSWKQVYKPRHMGSLRYMHRAITDMKVWGMKDRSIPPMAVLLDLSGSMNLEEKDVIQILEKQPASIVAGYSGSVDKGSLYILGQNGKYASEKEIENMRMKVGYSNVVDGPALIWLSQQKGRKIWISDGNVTGLGEAQSAGMFEFVDELLKRTGIEMYRSLYNLEHGHRASFWKRTFKKN